MVANEESLLVEVDSQLGKTSSAAFGIHAHRSDQEGSTPVVTPEKGPADGYSWRKYGQKHVKGNKFVRSYYRCTHPDCKVKKQVERTYDGMLTDTVIIGDHDHPRTQPSSVNFEEKTVIAANQTSRPSDHVDSPRTLTNTNVAADFKVHAVSQSTKTKEIVHYDGSPDSKRQKKEPRRPEMVIAEKPMVDPRHVLQTVSEVDMVNDGYRWRKYGQKFVKGNPNPRSYYRCSTAGCTAKKHVERASHDSKVVITTYERQHDHGIPSARMVSNSTPGNNTNQLQLDYHQGTDSDAADETCSDEKPTEQLNMEPTRIYESKRVDKVGNKLVSNSNSGLHSKISDQVSSKSIGNTEAVESSCFTDVAMATIQTVVVKIKTQEVAEVNGSPDPVAATSFYAKEDNEVRNETTMKTETMEVVGVDPDQSSPTARSPE